MATGSGATGRNLTLGIDVGTSSCKVVAVDPAGRPIATAVRPYPTRRTRDGEVTQDAADWLRAVAQAGREAVERAHADGGRVVAVGVTGVAHNAVLVGPEDRPLRRVLLYDDARPEATAERLRHRLGSGFFDRTYAALTATWTFPQLVWLRGEEPDLWPRLRHVLPMKDYVRWSLTGRGPGSDVTDPSDAAGTALVDQRSGAWDRELMEEAGLRQDQLPQIRVATALAGTLDRAWARRFGVAQGLPVAVGATDTAAELVSLDANRPGASLVKIASTGTVVAVSDQPRPDPAVLTYPHVIPGLWYSLAATNTAATSLSWLRTVVPLPPTSRPARDPGRELDRLVRGVAAGADGLIFLPFLEGERTPYWDRELRAAFIGLTSAHTTGHLYRATLEGVALSLRSCRDVMRRLGFRIETPYLAGGPIANPVWRAILVAALAEPARMAARQGPALGAALIAAAAVGLPPSKAGEPRTRAPSRAVRPRADWVAVYGERYELYRSAAEAVAVTSRALGRSSHGPRAASSPGHK